MACESNNSSGNQPAFAESERAEKLLLLERLVALDELIQSGVSTVTVDGTTTKFDLAEARKERESLLLRLGYKKRPPLCSRINLGGRR